ncbi:MAG: mechanosensitive ion channel family protein [Acidobacteriota bacterium]|nr:mechanosensitive ion channel family protein [Acidobacteriota bacterium]
MRFFTKHSLRDSKAPFAVLLFKYLINCVAAVGLLLASGFSQNASFAPPSASAAQATKPAPPSTSQDAASATSPLKPEEIVQFLTATIGWYRQTTSEQEIATEPGDVTFAEEDRRLANQIVRMAFEFARQEEQARSKHEGANKPDSQTALSQYQSLVQAAQQADEQVKFSEGEVQSFRRKLDAAPPNKRRSLQSTVAETESELVMLQARRDALHSMVDFISGSSSNGFGASGLRAQIEELARSVPSALAASANSPENDAASQQSFAKASPLVGHQQPSGIWGLSADLIRLSRKKRSLKQEVAATDDLIAEQKTIRTPLVARLRSFIRAGDALVNQEDSEDVNVLAQQKQHLDAVTQQFKQAAAVLLPLSKQGVLLDLYKRSATNWLDATKSEYRDELRGLLARLGVLLVVLAVLLGLGEVWRRTIFRYVHDVRRRYQFLLLRRIVLWILAVVIVAVTFATELGSVATFAGLLTAGVAVALQNVIVSIVGYFFLIGKFGIRVGDRVQISGVTGEVVDIGLVRMHLMELGSAGADSQPTGRVVAFSNSIVFQPTSGLFKQIPGTSFVWHDIDLTFSADSDYHLVHECVSKAVDTAFAEYRESMERQRRHMEMSLTSISAGELRPRVQLHLTPSGIEVSIRFPVDVEKAYELDEKVMSELLTAIEKEPRLKLLGAGVPTVKTEAPVA